MFLGELWNSLQHPPLSYLGDEFAYRSADGSNNSYTLPKLGAANTPYARSVRRKFMLRSALTSLISASRDRSTWRATRPRIDL